MFVYRLMLSCESRACESARSRGGTQVSARAYVDNVVGGRWSDCGVVLVTDLMAGFLDAAEDQVSGYYQNMLLGALRRELAGLASP